MILEQAHNTPLTAPQFLGASDFLQGYQVLLGIEYLTMDDLYVFLTTPTAERDAFIATLTPTVATVRNNYTTLTYAL